MQNVSIHQQLQKHDEAAREWLDAQYLADQLREAKNDVFARITSEQDGGSNAEKERKARLTQEWKDYRKSMVDAEDKARRARFWMKQKGMEFDGMRSMNAANRANMNAGGLVP